MSAEGYTSRADSVDADAVGVDRAMAAAQRTATALGLDANEATVLRASNRFTLRLLPSEVVARVAPGTHTAAAFEVDLATRLAGADSPVATLDPRVAPRVYEQDGFTITLWTYYPSQPSRELAPADYGDALVRLHRGMQRVDVGAPHFMDRVAEAERIVESRGLSREITAADRDRVLGTLTTGAQRIDHRATAQQLLHGEPHAGNVLNTTSGPLFIDLETACRGPIEFDLAHAPDEVVAHYPDVDPALLSECRGLVLAMVAAWRLDPEDQLPNGMQALRELLAALRAGPPYPALDTISGPD